MKVICPIVHLNGTSRQQLEDQIDDVYEACHVLLKALKNAAPNGRDYYPQPGLMDQAVAQHNRRMKVVTDLLKEVTEQQVAMLDIEAPGAMKP